MNELPLDPDLRKELEGLSEGERGEFLRLLSTISPDGDTRKVNSYIDQEYLERPVSISEFIHNEKFLGRALQDEQTGDFKIYPYWEAALEAIFSSDSITEIVFTGPIGSGKSTVIEISLAYLLYHVLCLRDPFSFYSLVRAQPISLLFFSLSKDLSDSGLFRGFSQLILSSEWFVQRGSITGSRYQILNFTSRNIEYALGSPKMAGKGITGRSIIGGALDEISEVTSAKEMADNENDFRKMRAFQIYHAVKRRMESRFLQMGQQPGKLFLASSKQDQNAFLERYVETIKGNPNVLIFDDPLWHIKPKSNFSGKTFAVAIGDMFHEPYVIPPKPGADSADDFEVAAAEAKGFDVEYPPIEFLEAFLLDPVGALRDIAGISTSSIRKNKLIPRAEYLMKCINPDLVSPFPSETIELPEKGVIGLEDCFEMRDEFRSPHYRYIHIDLAASECACGLGMGHVCGSKIVDRIEPDGSVTRMQDDIIRYDFIVRIVNVEGSRIPFWKVRRFILFLRQKGVNIQLVTTDGWQSEDTQQLLHNAGGNAEVFSIDRTDAPYVAFRTAVYEERLQYCNYPILIKEASELIHNHRAKKVDHPEFGSKDLSDVAAGVYAKAVDRDKLEPEPRKAIQVLEVIASKLKKSDPRGGLSWLGDI